MSLTENRALSNLTKQKAKTAQPPWRAGPKQCAHPPAELTPLYSKHLLSTCVVSSTVSGAEKAVENTTGSVCPQEVLLYPGSHATKKRTLTENTPRNDPCPIHVQGEGQTVSREEQQGLCCLGASEEVAQAGLVKTHLREWRDR